MSDKPKWRKFIDIRPVPTSKQQQKILRVLHCKQSDSKHAERNEVH